MSARAAPKPALPRWLGPFASRPRLLTAIGVGLLIAVLFRIVPNGVRPSTRAILSWDAGVVWFLATINIHMARFSSVQLRSEAARQDEGQHFIVALVLIAASASLGAIAIELSLAKGAHGFEKGLRIALAFTTVALSWFVVQVIFAIHYLHEYYAPEAPELDEDGNGIVGGLAFLDDAEPDYWDFIHFAVTISRCAQQLYKPFPLVGSSATPWT